MPWKNNDPEVRLEKIYNGDQQAREELIKDYTPFILSVASKLSGRFIRLEDEEASIAMIAFNEAIDGYRKERGGFIAFAEIVIKRRLIDYYRREKKYRSQVPLAEELLVANSEESLYTRIEVEEYKIRLQEFNLTFAELVSQSPKHVDSRRQACQIGHTIAITAEYREYLLEKKSLPLKSLESDKRITVSRKTLERQRKYIIAVALIYIYDLETLEEYVNF